MGKWVHRLSNIDEEARTAICAHCGPTTIRSRGRPNYTWKCNKARYVLIHKPRLPRGRNHHSAHKGDTCEMCGFVPEHPCQLDVHNHRLPLEERETLCANCHRLVTWKERIARRDAKIKGL